MSIIGTRVIVNESQAVGKVVEELYAGSIVLVEFDDGTSVMVARNEVRPQTFLTEGR